MTSNPVLRTRTRRIAAGTLLAAATLTGAAATASAATATPAAHAAAAVQACGNSSLSTSLRSADAATMHEGEVLVFTNVGKQTCVVSGYPGASIEHKSATLINAARTLNGFMGDGQNLTGVPQVTLKPGASGSAVVEWVENAGQKCYANRVGTLFVTPPNTTATVAVGSSLTIGQNGICSGFEIHPVVAGIIQD
jgi:hypothetical protein